MDDIQNICGKNIKDFIVAEMAKVELKWNNTALPVIDMQKDFIFGPVHVEGAKATQLLFLMLCGEIPIIWVVHEHDPLGRDVEFLPRHLYAAADKPKPASEGNVGAELVDDLVIEDGDYKLVKTRFSAFFNTHLHSYLQHAGVNNLFITGFQTPNCIRQTAFDAVALDYHKITVLSDATGAATPDVHLGNRGFI